MYPNCDPPVRDLRYAKLGPHVEMNLQDIAYGAPADFYLCFLACGKNASCEQAVHADGRCYPMDTAGLDSPNATSGQHPGVMSIRCNAGRGASSLCPLGPGHAHR